MFTGGTIWILTHGQIGLSKMVPAGPHLERHPGGAGGLEAGVLRSHEICDLGCPFWGWVEGNNRSTTMSWAPTSPFTLFL